MGGGIVGALVRRAVFGEAEYGRRAAKPPASCRPALTEAGRRAARYPCFEKLVALLVADFADVFFAAFRGNR